jgi:membrane associated rhomboid family serine protease
MERTLAGILSLPAYDLLIGSVLIVSVWGWLFRPVQQALMLVPARVARGEVHRLLTAGWVHADVWHLGVNMLTLHFFAVQTAPVLGAPRFLLLHATAVIAGFVPTTLRHLRSPSYASLGASGAVAAVMIAAVLLHPRLRLQILFFPTPVPGLYVALAYLAYSLWHSYSAGDGINHDAHLSGALYGALLTWIFEPARVERTVRAFF